MHGFGLKDIALSNLRRRKARSAFLAAGLLVGVASVVALLATVATMKTDVDRKMDEYGANMVVVPESLDLPLSYGGLAISTVSSSAAELTEQDAEKIRTIRNKENINIIAPKLFGVADVEGRRAGLLGVSFADELRMRHWWWLRGTPPAAADEVLLGSETARALGKDVGDRIAVAGAPMSISAVLEPTGTPEDSYVYADLHATQALLGKPGAVSVIEVSAWCSSCPIETIVLQTAAKLPHARVTAVKQAIATKADLLDVLSGFALAVSLLVLVVGSLIVLTTTMAAVHERTGEIGIFRAVGFRRRHVMQVILFEVGTLSLLSAVLGFAIGTLVAAVVSGLVAQAALPPQIDLSLGLVALGLAVAVGALGGIYPAWQAAKLDPVTALRAL